MAVMDGVAGRGTVLGGTEGAALLGWGWVTPGSARRDTAHQRWDLRERRRFDLRVCEQRSFSVAGKR